MTNRPINQHIKNLTRVDIETPLYGSPISLFLKYSFLSTVEKYRNFYMVTSLCRKCLFKGYICTMNTVSHGTLFQWDSEVIINQFVIFPREAKFFKAAISTRQQVKILVFWTYNKVGDIINQAINRLTT